MGWSSIPKIPKIASLECLYNISKKNLEMKLILCIKINIFLHFLQVDFQAWGIKVSYEVILSLLIGMIKHSQSTQSIKIEISLQYPKKRGWMDFIFCMHINIKVSLSLHYRF